MARDSSDSVGVRERLLSLWSIGLPPTCCQSMSENPGPLSMILSHARAEFTAPSILARLRTMPASCISRSIFFGV